MYVKFAVHDSELKPLSDSEFPKLQLLLQDILLCSSQALLDSEVFFVQKSHVCTLSMTENDKQQESASQIGSLPAHQQNLPTTGNTCSPSSNGDKTGSMPNYFGRLTLFGFEESDALQALASCNNDLLSAYKMLIESVDANSNSNRLDKMPILHRLSNSLESTQHLSSNSVPNDQLATPGDEIRKRSSNLGLVNYRSRLRVLSFGQDDCRSSTSSVSSIGYQTPTVPPMISTNLPKNYTGNGSNKAISQSGGHIDASGNSHMLGDRSTNVKGNQLEGLTDFEGEGSDADSDKDDLVPVFQQRRNSPTKPMPMQFRNVKLVDGSVYISKAQISDAMPASSERGAAQDVPGQSKMLNDTCNNQAATMPKQEQSETPTDSQQSTNVEKSTSPRATGGDSSLHKTLHLSANSLIRTSHADVTSLEWMNLLEFPIHRIASSHIDPIQLFNEPMMHSPNNPFIVTAEEHERIQASAMALFQDDDDEEEEGSVSVGARSASEPSQLGQGPHQPNELEHAVKDHLPLNDLIQGLSPNNPFKLQIETVVSHHRSGSLSSLRRSSSASAVSDAVTNTTRSGSFGGAGLRTPTSSSSINRTVTPDPQPTNPFRYSMHTASTSNQDQPAQRGRPEPLRYSDGGVSDKPPSIPPKTRNLYSDLTKRESRDTDTKLNTDNTTNDCVASSASTSPPPLPMRSPRPAPIHHSNIIIDTFVANSTELKPSPTVLTSFEQHRGRVISTKPVLNLSVADFNSKESSTDTASTTCIEQQDLEDDRKHNVRGHPSSSGMASSSNPNNPFTQFVHDKARAPDQCSDSNSHRTTENLTAFIEEGDEIDPEFGLVIRKLEAVSSDVSRNHPYKGIEGTPSKEPTSRRSGSQGLLTRFDQSTNQNLSNPSNSNQKQLHGDQLQFGEMPSSLKRTYVRSNEEAQPFNENQSSSFPNSATTPPRKGSTDNSLAPSSTAYYCRVRAGTLSQVLCYLVSERMRDPNLLGTIRTCFPVFTTAQDLCGRLIDFHKKFLQERSQLSANSVGSQHAVVWQHCRLTTAISECLVAIVPDLTAAELKQLQRVVYDMLKLENTDVAAAYLEDLWIAVSSKLQQEHYEEERTLLAKAQPRAKVAPPPLPINQRVSALLSLSSTDLARELCIIASKLFRKIKPSELLAWRSKQTAENSPNIVKMIEHFNRVAMWAATCVVNTSRLKQRVKVLTKLISIMKQLKKLQNFDTLLAILSGLESSATFRLKHTFNSLNAKSQSTLERLRVLMSHDKSFLRFRYYCRHLKPPVIPYLGMYLSDIVFIHVGNPDFLEIGLSGEECAINFAKV